LKGSKKSNIFFTRRSYKESVIKGLVIAATKSGSGKTTITLGLLAAFVQRGLKVAPFKVGPDFIDPGHHAAITGTDSHNLDGWMLSKNYNLNSFSRHTNGFDIALVEGVMGLFDGYDGKSEAGSTAQMAKWLGLPVLLVVDAKSMARSAAALVQGFERFDKEIDFAGVVFNNIGSRRHMDYLMEALEGNTALPCLGGIIRDEAIRMPERHLGLVTKEDHRIDEASMGRLARLVEDHMDVDRLLKNLPLAKTSTFPDQTLLSKEKRNVRIGVARDRAFCFYYPDNLELLESCGARLVNFSPIKDRHLPENLDGIYFGGGYPELAARELSSNIPLRREIREMSHLGMPILGECGGFMYLCNEMKDPEGNTFPMVGCFPFRTEMQTRLRSLGYREITTTLASPMGTVGLVARGHEFHYSGIADETEHTGMNRIFAVTERAGLPKEKTGFLKKSTLGSYIHLHFGSCPEVAESFVKSCLLFKKHRKVKS